MQAAFFAVRHFFQQIFALYAVQLQQIRGRAVFLLQNGGQQIGRLHFVLRRLLHMNHRPLHHALEAQCRLRVDLMVRQPARIHRRVLGNAFAQLHQQQRQIHALVLQQFRHRRITLHQSQQQMFQTHQLVTRQAGIFIHHLQNRF